MKRFTVWILLALSSMTATSSADIRYRVRSSFGELESFGRTPRKFDCSADIRTKLWRALSKQPVITRRENGDIDITFNFEGGKRQLATRQYNGLRGKLVAYWESDLPGLAFFVGITERRSKPPLVEIGIHLDITIALPDGSTSKTVCSETWSGIGDKF